MKSGKKPTVKLRVLVTLLAAGVLAVVLAGCASESREDGSREISPDPGGSSASAVLAEGSEPAVVVLGIAQDAGIPQAGSWQHPGWRDPAQRRLAVSLGLLDPRSGRHWLFDASPDLRQQLFRLREVTGPESELAGVFLTHAHMGHYAGLLFFGHESMGARDVPVYLMPRFAAYLAANGPWDQLVRYRNIELRQIEAGNPVELASDLRVTPFLVPHRQEYSEVVGYRIEGPQQTVLYLPDIDSWEDWDAEGTRLEEVLSTVDVAYLDATFYADGEIPGRDMSGFPHPFIRHTMDRLADAPDLARRVRFIHLNHTNPAQFADSEARATVEAAGMRVAEEGEIVRLGS